MIQLDPGLLGVVLSLFGTALLGGLAWILRTLSAQNTAMAGHSQALAVLVTRVDPTVEKTTRLENAVSDLNTRVIRLEIAGGQHSPSAVTVNAN